MYISCPRYTSFNNVGGLGATTRGVGNVGEAWGRAGRLLPMRIEHWLKSRFRSCFPCGDIILRGKCYE